MDLWQPNQVAREIHYHRTDNGDHEKEPRRTGRVYQGLPRPASYEWREHGVRDWGHVSQTEHAIGDEDDTDPSEDEADRFTGVAHLSKYLC